MMKHRGSGGPSDFWGECLESFTLFGGLAAVTERIGLYPSVTTLATHPMMAARMVATIDEISGGRCGLNIVTGWNKPEYTAMGIWPGDDYFDRRYDYAAEYTQVLRALWTQDRVDFHGEFFDLVDADMRPKPAAHPDGGVRRTVAGRPAVHRHLRRPELHHGRALEGRGIASGVKELGGTAQRDVGTFALYVVIAEETDAEADRRCAHIVEHADLEAISYMTTGASLDTNPDGTSAQLLASLERSADEGNMAFLSIPVVKGSYERVAAQLDEIAVSTGIDGALLTWPDFVGGITSFGERVKPLLHEAAPVAASGM